jgi:hypothetical protein
MLALQLQEEKRNYQCLKRYNATCRKKGHSFGSNTSYEPCYRHNEIMTKLITVLMAFENNCFH